MVRFGKRFILEMCASKTFNENKIRDDGYKV